ncbi:MAG: hypothetical protein IJX96_03465 [Clostridia bacterium]|nr:hypothetical protein [Clostridia bacterium]
MKKTKITALTLMLASAVLSTAVGGALLINRSAADEETPQTYALTDVFSATNAEIGAEGEGESRVTAFTLKDGGSVTMKRSLALKWYEKKGMASYFSTTFAFKTLDFESVTITMDSPSAWATKDEKATNKVVFTNGDDGVTVAVNDGEAKAFPITANEQLTLSLEEDMTEDGAFNVRLDRISASAVSEPIGKFTNIGANYAEYTANETYPLTIKAEAPDEATGDAAKTVVYLYDINGQPFDNISEDNKVTDDVAPVLVVNEDVNGFLLGTAFSLDYKVIDVLKSKSLTTTLEYYQYNPSIKEDDENYEKYKTLTTSVYFMDTVYYKDDSGNVVDKTAEGAIATTVFKEEGKELVSITLNADDGAKEQKYDLAWYAGTTVTKGNLDYIPVDKNEDGATYKFIQADEETKTNVPVDETNYNAAKAEFETSLADAASEVYAGSNSYIYFPSFKWLIGDNNGYRNLKFTISYKTPTSDSASTSSSLSYNSLKLSVASEGKYEFKIFANDKAGNTMKYYLDGELVSVTSSNVWDIEEIPAFTFEVANKGLKVEDTTSSGRKDTEDLDKTYSLDEVAVTGASSLQEEYKLYKVVYDNYNATAAEDKLLSPAKLANISYEQLASEIDYKQLNEQKDYFKLYLNAYATLLAEDLGLTADETTVEKILSCFVEIKEYDSRITEDNAPEEWAAYNKYNWSASSQSFDAVEEGTFLIVADYWEAELASSQRAMAYKVVEVKDPNKDVIEGENNWLKNNMVSVILFAIAGVMLILIIILLLIKPSDETLEDVDAQATKAKKEKKNKKNK